MAGPLKPRGSAAGPQPHGGGRLRLPGVAAMVAALRWVLGRHTLMELAVGTAIGLASGDGPTWLLAGNSCWAR